MRFLTWFWCCCPVRVGVSSADSLYYWCETLQFYFLFFWYCWTIRVGFSRVVWMLALKTNLDYRSEAQNWGFMCVIEVCIEDQSGLSELNSNFDWRTTWKHVKNGVYVFLVVVFTYIGCTSLGVVIWFEGRWRCLDGMSLVKGYVVIQNTLWIFCLLGVFSSFILCYELMACFFSSLNCILFKSVIIIFYTKKIPDGFEYDDGCWSSFTIPRSVSSRNNVNI